MVKCHHFVFGESAEVILHQLHVSACQFGTLFQTSKKVVGYVGNAEDGIVLESQRELLDIGNARYQHPSCSNGKIKWPRH